MGRHDNQTVGLIGLAIPDVEMRHNAQILKGVEAEAIRSGYEVLVCNSQLDPDRERSILQRMAGRDLAGLLIQPFFDDTLNPEYAALLRSIRDGGTPVVLIDQYVAEADIPAVMTDKVHMGYAAIEHLIMLGHRRICYVCSGRHDTAGQQNLMGCRQALNDYEIELDESLILEFPVRNSAEPARKALAELYRRDSSFTAVASPAFSMTYGVMNALADLGLSVPGDIAVVGGDAFLNPRYEHVTHMLQEHEEMGRQAAQLLLQRGDSHGEPLQQHRLIRSRLVIGDSCGSKRKVNANE
jgi:DNA-binding LacI/PurR family transcriptional regulator